MTECVNCKKSLFSEVVKGDYTYHTCLHCKAEYREKDGVVEIKKTMPSWWMKI